MKIIEEVSKDVEKKFILSDLFIEKYKKIKPPFGFNGLGELVYLRTYSRIKENGDNEIWWETVKRVVEGCFNMQKKWIEEHRLGWNNRKAQSSAHEMFDRIFNMKFFPPGRGLWAMGSVITEERKLYAALNNCAFVSTSTLKEDYSKPFCFLMDMSMLGVGVGFDTLGNGQIIIKGDNKKDFLTYQIKDDRESWVESIKLLLESYFFNTSKLQFDYSLIRKEGELIKGFGGFSSGSKPLEDCHNNIIKVLDKNINKEISTTTIVDIMNLLGKCIIAGNVRRTAEIVFGDSKSEEYLDLKNYKVNPHRESYGWTSNNSIFAEIGMDYSKAASRTAINGEPGYFWLDNARNYSRMNDGPDRKDIRACGANPCVSGETEILTKKGFIKISLLVNQEIEIWNGFEWSNVIPKITGYNQEMIKINFSDGRNLKCTKHHEFWKIIDYWGKKEKVKAIDLKIGDKLIKHDFPIIKDGENFEFAYTQGFISAEGMDGYNYFWLYEPKFCCLNRLQGKESGSIFENINGIKKKTFRFYFESLSKNFVPLEWNLKSKLEWLSGYLDGEGCELKEGGVQAVSIDKEFLLNIQKLLSLCGVQSKIVFMIEEGDRLLPDGYGSYKEYFCKKSWRICIGAKQIQFLKTLGLHCERLKLEKFPNRDASQFSRVISIEESDIEDIVYCFNEPIKHLGCFNGIVTGQCNEQTLESYELCCLVETFPDKHESLDDFIQTLKYAYLYAKTVTLGKTHWPETNRVMLRNRRIGCSISGIVQFITNKGINNLKEWCEKGYQAIEEYDIIYSDWLAIPKSIKKTSIKPSGTVSLLNGSTPGVHFPESRYYIRRIRLSKNSNLVKPLEEAGYKIESCFGSEDNTLVVEIPVSLGGNIRTIEEVSMWEQLNLAAFLQKYWADNQVSCTVTFKENEANQIKYALEYFQYQLKGISFLPKFERENKIEEKQKTPYKQMPYQSITEKEYNDMIKNIKIVKFKRISNEQADVEKFCNTDVCELKV